MKIKKYLFEIIFSVFVIFILTSLHNKSFASLYLNNLDFDVKVNSDASIDVTEIWNIDIEETNTLFKTFKTDKTKYSSISNVTVTDITTTNEIAFSQINQLMYHVTKNCYYGMINKDGNFEIAWGVGLDNSKATRKYMVQYKVEDAIAKYNDYSELYWQFVGNDFEIDSSKVTGKIRLPQKASNKDEIKVWGHTEDLNGEIYATTEDTIEFEINNYRSGRFIEIRSLFPTNMIYSSNRTYNKTILDSVIAEETKWAEEANTKRLKMQRKQKYASIGVSVLYCLLSLINLKNTKKSFEKAKTIIPYKKTINVEYFREIPRSNSTPAQAVMILKKSLNMLAPNEIGPIFSATLLDLNLKKCIEFEVSPTDKKDIKIKILKRYKEDLETSEKLILDFINNLAKEQDEITVKELRKYMKKEPTKISELKENIEESSANEIKNMKLYDEERAKEKLKYELKPVAFIIFSVMLVIMTSIPMANNAMIYNKSALKYIILGVVLVALTAIINLIAVGKVAKKLQPFTDEGINESEQWKGLKKFMENFSMLDKREIPELALWEHYLVYATAFGIADKVIKQLKIVYKDLYDNMDMNNYGYMYLMMHTDFSSNFSHAISSSYSSTLSSGSGSGGGFSGGGGGGRRRPEAVAVDSHGFILQQYYKSMYFLLQK